jgi:hypothetical protein
MNDAHKGISLSEWLEQEGIKDEVEIAALKRVVDALKRELEVTREALMEASMSVSNEWGTGTIEDIQENFDHYMDKARAGELRYKNAPSKDD